MKAVWEAVALEPKVYHKRWEFGDDDDASVCVHGDDLMVESRAKAVSSAGGTGTYLAMDRLDIAYSILRANQDIAKPKVQTEARLKRVARNLLGEPELIWTFPYQEMTKLVRTDAKWTGQDSSCAVRFGEHVIDVCSKQDVVSWSAPESEFHAKTSGGAHGIHTKNIFSDWQVDVFVLETDQRIWHLSTPWCAQERALVARTSNWDGCQVRTIKQI